MIRCQNLTRTFGSLVAVDQISFEVAPGTICAVIGPNGAGKSTTLKMLTGLLAPSSGEVQVCGHDVARNPVELRRLIGVLPEDLGLFDDLTLEEHLLMTGEVWGLDAATTRTRTGELLSAFDLREERHTFAGSGSHGMRKKTALAMALLPNPRVLFLDEPLEGLDPVIARFLVELLERISRNGVTVCFTSHLLSVAEKIATQVVLIQDGRVVCDSPTSELPRALEEHYFQLVETRVGESLQWLGHAPS